jgi:hypothetical protein
MSDEITKFSDDSTLRSVKPARGHRSISVLVGAILFVGLAMLLTPAIAHADPPYPEAEPVTGTAKAEEPDETTDPLLQDGQTYEPMHIVRESPAAENEGVVAPLDIAATGWTTIMTQTFEGSFPSGLWVAYDGDGSTNGEYYWDEDDYKPHNGSKSAWAANGGANGMDPASHNYPNNASSWMDYGPFDLSDADDAELLFYFWNQSEPGYDVFSWWVSIDGLNWYGVGTSGDSGGWQYVNYDLTDVYSIGDVTGQPEVWISFGFWSDETINSYKGPFVDDIVLQKNVVASGPDLTPFAPSGWDYPIVPSSETGTTTIGVLYPDQDTYIDWAVLNDGESTSTTFYNCLYFGGMAYAPNRCGCLRQHHRNRRDEQLLGV